MLGVLENVPHPPKATLPFVTPALITSITFPLFVLQRHSAAKEHFRSNDNETRHQRKISNKPSRALRGHNEVVGTE